MYGKREGYYLITFKDYSDIGYSMFGAPRPVFKVVFEDFGDQTGIRTQFMNLWILKKPLFLKGILIAFGRQNWIRKG